MECGLYMRKNYTLVKLCLLFCCCCMLLCGCFRQGSLGANKLFYAYEIGCANIPGFCDKSAVDAVKLDFAKVLQTDCYGRTIVEYSGSVYSDNGNNKIELVEASFLIVCQMLKSNEAYYYEDICYIARSNDSNDFAKDEINSLMEANDWNKELDLEKMTSVIYDPETGIDHLEDNCAVDEVVVESDEFDTKHCASTIIGKLDDSLLICHVITENQSLHDIEAYLIVIDTEINEIVAKKMVSKALNIQEDIRLFKEEQTVRRR